MGDVTDNYKVGEHLQMVSGTMTSLGWGVSWARTTPASHDWSQPDITRAELDDLITSAKNNPLSTFDSDADDAWGSWWTGLSSIRQQRVYEALKASSL